MTKTVDRPRARRELSALLPEIDDATRREFLIGAAGLLVLAPYGCGGESVEGRENVSGGTRTVENVYGETEIPNNPRRVITLDPTVLLDVLALGVTPVGYAGADASQPLFLRDDLRGVESVGTESEPSVEKIAALEPDLIMGYTQRPKVMGEIAPTVDVEYDETEWKRMFCERAGVLGKGELADKKIAGFDGRVREFQEEMGDRLDKVTVSMVRFGEENVAVYPASFSGSVLADIGVKRPPNQAYKIGECCVELSVEKIPRIDADYVFVAVDPGAEEQLGEYEANPLWGRLDGKKIEADSATWIQPSYTTATRILDDLEKHLL